MSALTHNFTNAFSAGTIPFSPALKGSVTSLCTCLSCKADTPAPWWKNARSLELLLRGAWNEVSSDFLSEMRAHLNNLDLDAMDGLVRMADGLGVEMSKLIGNKAEALLATLEQKADAAWTLYGKKALNTSTLTPLDPQFQKHIANVQATQIKKFSEAFPKRILHPEITRQIQYLRDSDLTRSVDVSRLDEKLTHFIKQERYWENLSDVQTARLWHTDGVMLANQNGVRYCQVTGPFDERTCPVCNRMMGMKIAVDPAVKKVKADINITDPDKYVEAWTFPRIADIDNMSREAIEEKGLMPPFHNRCRHTITWLSK